MMKTLFAFALLTSLLFVACSDDLTAISDDVDCSTITYSGTIAPLISQNCGSASCHGSGGQGGNLMTYDLLIVDVDNGNFEREVLREQTMPRNSSLTSTELGEIQCWIDAGAPEN